MLIAPFALSYMLSTAPVNYDLRVVFTGMIPILGGNDGTAEVQLGVQVQGLAPKDGQSRATSELTRAKIIFNGGALPLTLDNVKDYFPKTTVEYTPLGKITKSDAPDIELPVRLPGLDIKRFPDITYLPVEFPAEGPELGQSWKFEKSFAGSPVTYQCKLEKVDDATATVTLSVEQVYTVLEDAAMQVVHDKADAENEVTTTMKASGQAVFDRRGWVILFKMTGRADSVVKPVAGGATTDRQLAISVECNKAK
ncbi:MAG: hypothetical protein IT205_03785 [Fimbriimonadaceae bacterium]|nr:hypothetical protein [Fimbriimonadaceae bacterium]